MLDLALDVGNAPAGIALVPGAVELLGGGPKLHDEVAGQVLWVGLAPLLLPEADLARAAKLGLSTVVDFEKERRLVSEEAVKAIQTALQRAGIEFMDENGLGEGLLLRKRQKRT
jgi:hypothetical protein